MERRVEDRLVYGFVRAEHELRVVLDNALRDLGVTLTQWTVLSFLLREPGLSAADLRAAALSRSKGWPGSWVAWSALGWSHARNIRRTGGSLR